MLTSASTFNPNHLRSIINYSSLPRFIKYCDNIHSSNQCQANISSSILLSLISEHADLNFIIHYLDSHFVISSNTQSSNFVVSAILNHNISAFSYLISLPQFHSFHDANNWNWFHHICHLGLTNFLTTLLHTLDSKTSFSLLYSDNDIGLSPFHLAISRGRIPICEILVDFGFNYKLTTSLYSPLHVAAFVGRIDCVQFLLDIDISPDILNSEGNTCLHIAAMEGEVNVIQILIDHHANTLIANHHNQLPSHLAIPETRPILERHQSIQHQFTLRIAQLLLVARRLLLLNLTDDVKRCVLERVLVGFDRCDIQYLVLLAFDRTMVGIFDCQNLFTPYSFIIQLRRKMVSSS
ncbi:ankyrin repeat-containing domain protein [Globomyces pollinis-pini]|nr:ankyrin repeat-containing domain protein [Globomyces pollinis-pini]